MDSKTTSVVSKHPVLRTLAAILVLGAGAASCGPEAPRQLPAPMVTVAQPERRDVTDFVEFTGKTRSVASAEIRARVAGILERMHFEPSVLVREGDLLFTIEQGQYRALRDQAYANHKAAQADLARARSDLERIRLAIRTRAVSEQDLDRAFADSLRAEASVLSTRALLDRAELDLSYTLVRSPVTGQVGRNLVDLGNLVGQGQSTLLTTVNQLDPIFVYFDVPERVVLETLASVERNTPDSARAKAKQVWVRLANETGYAHQGRIDFVSNTVDPATGTIEVRGVFPNADVTMFPGLFVRVRMARGELPRAILVLERAVGTDIGGKYVYVVGEGNVVEQRYVRLGPLQDDGTVVVLEGLEGGETYIANGMLKARPGLPVDPRTPGEMRALMEKARQQAAGK